MWRSRRRGFTDLEFLPKRRLHFLAQRLKVGCGCMVGWVKGRVSGSCPKWSVGSRWLSITSGIFLKTLYMLKVDKTHDLSLCWMKSFDSPRVSKASGDVIPMWTKVSSCVCVCVCDVLQNLVVLWETSQTSLTVPISLTIVCLWSVVIGSYIFWCCNFPSIFGFQQSQLRLQGLHPASVLKDELMDNQPDTSAGEYHVKVSKCKIHSWRYSEILLQ